jgi:hypothetical protein
VRLSFDGLETNMLPKILCFSAAALVFMSAAYPQGALPPAAPVAAPVPQPVVAPSGIGASTQNAAQTDEAIRSNPDPALQRFNRGFDRNNDNFVAPTMNLDIKGSGISLPTCVAEAKEGKTCD